MPGYTSYLCEVPQVDEVLEEINKEGVEISQVVFVSDSAQVLLICKEGKKSFLNEMKKKIETKKLEEPEGE